MRHRHPCEKSRERMALGPGSAGCGGDALRTVGSGEKACVSSGLLQCHVSQTPVVCIPLLQVFAKSAFHLF